MVVRVVAVRVVVVRVVAVLGLERGAELIGQLGSDVRGFALAMVVDVGLVGGDGEREPGEHEERTHGFSEPESQTPK